MASISHAAVFADQGHGALGWRGPVPLEFLAVVGPRRAMLADGFARLLRRPHGDQMLAGCFGLLRACADVEPAWRRDHEALAGEADRSLW